MEIEIRSISRGLQVADFDCGHAALNEWLVRYAHQNQRRNMSRTFVATQPGSDRVLGYYTSLASELGPYDANLTSYNVPSMLVARLAVSLDAQGLGLGMKLLKHAFDSATKISQLTGLCLVAVSAIDESVADFYSRFGFEALSSDPLKLIAKASSL